MRSEVTKQSFGNVFLIKQQRGRRFELAMESFDIASAFGATAKEKATVIRLGLG
jgi:hypothetical protein